MVIQPSTAAMHQITGESLNASMKFSVLIEQKSDRHMAFTRFFGTGAHEAMKAPAKAAAPAQKFTVPRTPSPPDDFESIIGDSAALYAEAMRFMPDKKNISLSMSGFAPSHESPDFTDTRRDSFAFFSFRGSGILINSSSAVNAAAKVIISALRTADIPPNANNMVASIGVSIEFICCEKERSAPVF